jgi:hypothetical protein
MCRGIFELVVRQVLGINPALLDRPKSRELTFAEHLPQLDCSADLAALHVIGGLSQLDFHENTVSSSRLAPVLSQPLASVSWSQPAPFSGGTVCMPDEAFLHSDHRVRPGM